MRQWSLLLLLALLFSGTYHANAKLLVTRQRLNMQQGLALSQGTATVSWASASEENGDRQTAYQIVVRENATHRLVYDSQKTKGDRQTYIDLPALQPNDMGYTWQVRLWDRRKEASPWSSCQMFYIVPKEFHAKWIGFLTRKEAHLPEGRWANTQFKKPDFKAKWAQADTLSSRSIELRKEFRTKNKGILHAVVYVSGLGHYELSINGRKIGTQEFAPLWSEYTKTVYYNAFDVTKELLSSSQNAIHALLGNGFYNVQKGNRYSKLQTSFGTEKLFLQLVITYSGGERQTIVTDESWRVRPSAVTFNSIYGGESFDARLWQEEALSAGYDDTVWQQAKVVETPSGVLRPQTAPHVRIMERYSPKRWTAINQDSLANASKKMKRTVSPTAIVADMGQNLAGFPEIKVQGKRGDKITLFVSENLTPQGVCNQRETGRQHFYEYTLKGDGVETWHPRFSYYGFRYIQVEGAALLANADSRKASGKALATDSAIALPLTEERDTLPRLLELTSCFVYNSLEETSSFSCSNDLFTKTHRLIERAERSNMQAVLSDCPHREKLGWLEQDHLCGMSLLYNYDMGAYIPKIIRDILDTQKPDGMVPTTAPQYVSFGNLFDDSPEWGATLLVLPFMYYAMYGDKSIILDNYEAMRRYTDYLTSRSDDHIVSHGLGDWYDYGPWVAGFSKNTPVPLVATAHYIICLRLTAQAAKMKGLVLESKRYTDLEKKTTEAFLRHFYNKEKHSFATGSQTANALPLFLEICGKDKPLVLQSLIEDIKKHGNRLTTGDVGNRYLFQTLARNGHNELLYTMLNHDEAPGYGFQLKFGATTLTEQWDPRMGTSWNHFMMGQADEWLFQSLLGISQEAGQTGMRHLLISPSLVGDLTWVEGGMETLFGRVSLRCEKHTMQVKIPVGCTATVRTLDGKKHSVKSGRHTFSW